MDDLPAQASEQTLFELVCSTLEHLRNLQLKGPSTFKQEHYAKAWRLLATAGNHLIYKIEDLRFSEHDRWETGDEASVELFGRLGVPKAKEFLQEVMLELAFLGTKWNVGSAHARIDTRPFDPEKIPRLVEVENENIEMEEVRNEDIEMEDANEEIVKKEAIKTEIISPSSPQNPAFPRSNQPFPTPPPQSDAETTTNTAPPHPPLQYPSPQRFRTHLSSIDSYASTHPMFTFPTPTSVRKDLPPPEIIPQSVSAMESERKLAAEQEYMAAVKRVAAYVASVVYLMRPLPGASRQRH